MARLFTCGFENGTDQELTAANAYFEVVSTIQRTGTYSGRFQNNLGAALRGWARCAWIEATSTVYLRFAARFGAGCFAASSTNTSFMVFYDNAGAEQFTITWNDGLYTFDLYNPSNVRLATGTVGLREATWYVIEVAIVVATSGTVTLKVNGTTALAYAGDTDITNNGYVQSVYWQGWNSADLDGYWYIDDIAINDTTGSYQNSWAGLGGVFYLEPTADGAQNDWTPSTGTVNYAMVDEIPPDDATTYNQGLTNGEIELYEIDDCPDYIATVNVVEVVYEAALATSGYNELTDLVRIGTVNYSGTAHTVVPITPAFTLYKGTPYYLSPATGTVWGTAEINGMQAGVEITV